MKLNKKLCTIALSIVLTLSALLPQTVLATGGTDGTELQVMEAEQLEIQLGADWVGVEFELKTDAGMYPGTITVGADGVLRLEIGGSKSYVLSCLNSAVSAPVPTQAPATEEAEPTGNTVSDTEDKAQEPSAETATSEPENTESEPPEENGNTIAGIPVVHLIIFVVGILIAVGVLIGMHYMSKKDAVDADYEECDDD